MTRGIAKATGRPRGIDVKLEFKDPNITLENGTRSLGEDDEAGQFDWAIQNFIASRQTVLTGEVSNELFDFKLETMDEDMRRYFGSK
ncbi:MAG: hypothetical protein MMC23_001120 [Stictis urceolatum]|nr:hypothetical protein [Stictis urceolata]